MIKIPKDIEVLDNGLMVLNKSNWESDMYVYDTEEDKVYYLPHYNHTNPMQSGFDLLDPTDSWFSGWMCLFPQRHLRIVGGLMQFLANKKKKILYSELT